MIRPARVAVVGDVHLKWDERDVRWFDTAGYDLILFVGDLAGYKQDASAVARSINQLRTPAFVIPGNHDATSLPHLAAETFERPRLARLLGGGHDRRVEKLREALGSVPLVGYSRHELGAHGLTLISARPHSQGGSFFAFGGYLSRAFGVRDFDQSAARLAKLVDEAEHERVVFLAHNGPTGLGAARTDIWGCDFKREAGDWGDDDLRCAIEHARASGRRVLAVLAGHMHHRVKGGGKRTWKLERDGTLYVNAANVPRIRRSGNGQVRHHVEVAIDETGARATPIEVPFD